MCPHAFQWMFCATHIMIHYPPVIFPGRRALSSVFKTCYQWGNYKCFVMAPWRTHRHWIVFFSPKKIPTTTKSQSKTKPEPKPNQKNKNSTKETNNQKNTKKSPKPLNTRNRVIFVELQTSLAYQHSSVQIHKLMQNISCTLHPMCDLKSGLNSY